MAVDYTAVPHAFTDSDHVHGACTRCQRPVRRTRAGSLIEGLLKAYRAAGPVRLVSHRRGTEHRQLPEELRSAALELIRERYSDFGPTLARKKLDKLHSFWIGKETLRRQMIGAGTWLPRDKRLARPQQPRHRRDCVGELVQIDGSEHAWFEDRGPTCMLLVYVDDATSRLMELRVVRGRTYGVQLLAGVPSPVRRQTA